VLNAYNAFWWDSGTKVLMNMRTSIIVDPPDGRIPPLTSQRQAQLQEKALAIKVRCERPGCAIANSGQPSPADKPEELDLMTRCISFGTVVPMLPSAYNNDYQIVQGPGVVAIDTEMVHEVRRIPTDGSPHLPSNVREWIGDPRGHWDGDTLVVDTVGPFFATPKMLLDTAGHPVSEDLHIVEHFHRIDATHLGYEVTVSDPKMYTKPFTNVRTWVLMPKSEEILEYVCTENNKEVEEHHVK
jgi:hypothetical protein